MEHVGAAPAPGPHGDSSLSTLPFASIANSSVYDTAGERHCGECGEQVPDPQVGDDPADQDRAPCIT